jgi:hypothetical protein
MGHADRRFFPRHHLRKQLSDRVLDNLQALYCFRGCMGEWSGNLWAAEVMFPAGNEPGLVCNCEWREKADEILLKLN